VCGGDDVPVVDDEQIEEGVETCKGIAELAYGQ